MGDINWEEHEREGIVEKFFLGCLFAALYVGFYISEALSFFKKEEENWDEE